MKVTDNPYYKSASGLEIKDWVWYNAHHDTKYTKTANALMYCFNFPDNKNYTMIRDEGTTKIIEVEERGM